MSALVAIFGFTLTVNELTLIEFLIALFGLVIAVAGTILAVIGIIMQRSPDQLEMSLIDGSFGDVDNVNNQSLPARFFHIAVRNNHTKRVARNCYAYLISLKEIGTDTEHIVQSFELKWRAYQLPSATILPNTYRKFDAFWIIKAKPQQLIVSAFVDSNSIIPYVNKTVDLRAIFWVVSENFKTVKRTFIIHLDLDIKKVSISLEI